MTHSRLFAVLTAIPLALALVLAAGCGDSGKKDGAPAKDGGGTKDGTTSSGPAKKLEAYDAKGTGTIEGKVVYDGNPPAAEALDMSKDDTGHCKKAPDEEKAKQTWKIVDGGVANVIVYVKAPDGKFFKIDADKAKKEDVVIKQPFCAFEPHVFALFPSYYDAASGKQKPTGQKLKVENNAPIPHNSNVEFGHPKLTSGKNQLLPPHKEGEKLAEMDFTDIKTSTATTAGGIETVKIGCNIHPWMSAYGQAFDHPFFTVTKDGKFKIENVPAGGELEVFIWHESMAAPKSLGKVKVEDGKTATVPEAKIK
ncbi:hypothetical protein AYO40_06785 [Planctomycetaceae bacterium SCGC AG-212-D15]|nr:hypothetical protein AYO40_06785 [Planctomycetaceae bacterium SCGC AG-212-D15]